MRRLLAVALASLVAPLAVQAAETPAEADAITFGVAAVYGDELAARDGKAIGDYLTRSLGRSVVPRAFHGYDELAGALASKEVDLAWITPLAYVQALRSGPAMPLAKALRKGMFYRSCLLVRADRPEGPLAGLKGSKAAWVDKTSTSGYLLPMAMLLKGGLKTTGFFAGESFVGSHGAVCEAVASGKADIGGTYTDATSNPAPPNGCVEAMGAEKAATLKCLAASDLAPNEVIAARVGFDELLASDITGLFANLGASAEGRKLLSDVFHAEGFGFALEEDFDSVRAMARSVESGKWVDPVTARRRDADMLLNNLSTEETRKGDGKKQDKSKGKDKPKAKKGK